VYANINKAAAGTTPYTFKKAIDSAPQLVTINASLVSRATVNMNIIQNIIRDSEVKTAISERFSGTQIEGLEIATMLTCALLSTTSKPLLAVVVVLTTLLLLRFWIPVSAVGRTVVRKVKPRQLAPIKFIVNNSKTNTMKQENCTMMGKVTDVPYFIVPNSQSTKQSK
jgi:hypothetical protein